RPQHRRVQRFVLEQPLPGRLPYFRVGGEHVTVVPGAFGRGDLRQAAEVGAGRLVEADLRLPLPDPGDRAGEVHDRVRLQRDRSVAGNAVRPQFDAARNLLQRLDGGVFGDTADADRAAAFGQ